MTDRVEAVAAFAKCPFIAGEELAQSKVIGGDVLLAARKSFFGGGELIHEREAEVVLFRGEIHTRENTAVALASLPTDLFAEPGFVTGSPHTLERAQKAGE